MIGLAYAMAQQPQAQGAEAPSPILSLMPIIFIFIIFYFLLILPQKKKQDQHKKMVASLKKNDHVVTALAKTSARKVKATDAVGIGVIDHIEPNQIFNTSATE